MGTEPPRKILKRARPVHSCVLCRSKKIKCDRQSPCEMCVMAGRGHDCVYDSFAGSLSRLAPNPGEPSRAARSESEVSSHTLPTRSAGSQIQMQPTLGVIESLQARVDKLERLTEQQGDNRALSRSHVQAEPDLGPTNATIESINVRDDHSERLALTNKASILTQFDDVKKFIVSKASDRDSGQVLADLRRKLPKQTEARNTLNGEADCRLLMESLNRLIPLRNDCDRLISIYFDHFENLQCIVDKQTFLCQHELFWRDRDSQGPIHHSMLSRTALICSLASAIDQPDHASTVRSACGLVGIWISRLEGKRAFELSNLQAHTMYATTLMFSGASPSKVWRTSGILVRLAMLAGLHQNQKNMGSIDTEMARQRRMLWITIVELDLQASLICGFPPSLTAGDIGCDSTSARVADSKLRSVLGLTLHSRLDGARLLHGQELDTADIWQTVEKLGHHQSDAVSSLASHPDLETAMFITVLHRSVLAFSRPLYKSPEASKARILSTQSCLNVLSCIKSLEGGTWLLYFTSCSQDVFQAALVVCFMARMLKSSAIYSRSQQKSVLEQSWDPSDLLAAVEETHCQLLKRTPTDILGNHLKDLIALGVVLSAIRAPRDSVNAAMDRAFSDVIQSILQRASDKPSSSVPAMDGVPSSTGSSRSPPWDALHDMDPGFLFNVQLDFDSGFLFDQTYPFDPNVFRFDPELE